MRFSLVVVASIFAVVGHAASATTATASSTINTAAAAQSSEIACLDKCAEGDVNCQAACISVPAPDAAQVNATTGCAMDCNQGDGSAADTASYASCVNSCISYYFYTTELAADATGTAAGAAAASASVTGDSSSGSASQTSGSSSSATGSAAAATSSSASDTLRMGVSLVGLVGGFAAILAL